MPVSPVPGSVAEPGRRPLRDAEARDGATGQPAQASHALLGLQPAEGNHAVAQLMAERSAGGALPVLAPHVVLGLQQAAGNHAVARLVAARGAGAASPVLAPRPDPTQRRLDRQGHVAPGSGPVTAQGDEEYKRVFADYQKLLEAGKVHSDDKAEVDHAIALMNDAARDLRNKQSAGSTALKFALGGVALAGALLADDVTGIGVADDVAIPPVLIAAGVAALLYLALRSDDAEVKTAAARLNSWTLEATKIMTGILMAAKAGARISGQMHRLAEHLARLTNNSVAGKPPDHQKDPKGFNEKHWWGEVIKFLKEIISEGLSPKQLARELQKYEWTKEMIQEIIEALRNAKPPDGPDPPNFPPIAWP